MSWCPSALEGGLGEGLKGGAERRQMRLSFCLSKFQYLVRLFLFLKFHGGEVTRFICNIASSGEASAFGCQCATCQDAWKPVTAAGPQPAPAVTTVDVPGDASTSFSVAVGTPLIGVLEVDADHDWYSVDLVAGTLYRITLDGLATDEFEALEDPYIYLRDANGSVQPPFYVPLICVFTKYVSGAGGRIPRAWWGRIWLYCLSH